MSLKYKVRTIWNYLRGKPFPGLSNKQRKSIIEKNGKVTPYEYTIMNELSKINIDVTIDELRQDFNEMEKEGLIKKCRNGKNKWG